MILAIVVGVVVIAVLAMMASRSRRSAGLRDQFGPEYDRTVSPPAPAGRPSASLQEREQRYESMDIRPLSEAARARYTEDWQRAERLFVDDPELAAREADRIVRDVLDDARLSQTTTSTRRPPRCRSTTRARCSATATGTRWCTANGASRARSGRRTSARRWWTSASSSSELVEPAREPVEH